MPIQFKSVSDFFPRTQHDAGGRRRPLKTMEKAVWQDLPADTFIDGIMFAAGSKFKVFETKNFGWVVFAPEARTPEGHFPGRRIFQW